MPALEREEDPAIIFADEMRRRDKRYEDISGITLASFYREYAKMQESISSPQRAAKKIGQPMQRLSALASEITVQHVLTNLEKIQSGIDTGFITTGDGQYAGDLSDTVSREIYKTAAEIYSKTQEHAR